MGACESICEPCCTPQRIQPKAVQRDLVSKKTLRKNLVDTMVFTKYEEFQGLFPLKNTHLVNFVHKIRQIESKDDMISLNQLKGQFQTPKWQRERYWVEDSEFKRLLQSLPGGDDEGERFNRLSLLLLGFLWCQCDKYNKAEIFFEFLNPPEKGQCQHQMSCNDKDWPHIFETLIIIASICIPNAFDEVTKKRKEKLNKRVQLWNKVKLAPSPSKFADLDKKDFVEDTGYESPQTIPDFDGQGRRLSRYTNSPGKQRAPKLKKRQSLAIDAMRLCELNDLKGLIPNIFEYDCLLKRKEFVKILMTEECGWIFCPFKIRARMKIFMNEKYTNILKDEIGQIFGQKHDFDDLQDEENDSLASQVLSNIKSLDDEDFSDIPSEKINVNDVNNDDDMCDIPDEKIKVNVVTGTKTLGAWQ